MGKGARQEKSPCVFCGSDAKYSAEHVLAKHWRQFHGPERGPVFHRGFSRGPDGMVRKHESVKETKLFDHGHGDMGRGDRRAAFVGSIDACHPDEGARG